jgi:head-tail adaptor
VNKPNINADIPTVNPGTFRHQITLLSPVAGSDASGATLTYQASVPPVTAWASIDYIRGADLIKSGQEATQAIIKVTSWYRSQFTPQSRLQLPSGASFIIQYLENVKEMNTFMILTCLGLGSADK